MGRWMGGLIREEKTYRSFLKPPTPCLSLSLPWKTYSVYHEQRLPNPVVPLLLVSWPLRTGEFLTRLPR